MQLALRKTAATGASWTARFAAWAIKARLVSAYCHGGIVIGNRIYHATATHGLTDSDFTAEHWDLFDVGTDKDLDVLNMYQLLKGTQYDWFSLLAFVLPWRLSDASRMYCFEWCWMCLENRNPTERITPEALLKKTIEMGIRGSDATQAP